MVWISKEHCLKYEIFRKDLGETMGEDFLFKQNFICSLPPSMVKTGTKNLSTFSSKVLNFILLKPFVSPTTKR